MSPNFCSLFLTVIIYLNHHIPLTSTLQEETNSTLIVNGSDADSNKTAEDYIDEYYESIPRLVFGVLHTMENLSFWAAVEEQLDESLTVRLKLIEQESKLIKSFLADYDESTKEALKNVHSPKPSYKERGQVVGSSIVLGHRMASRYNDITRRLREFLNSAEYVKNQDYIKRNLGLLEVTPEPVKENLTETVNDTDTTDEEEIYIDLVPGAIITNSFSDLPDWKDKYMSFNSFIPLQEVNGMPPKLLSKGLTIDTAYGGVLSAFQCVEIAMFALHRLRFSSGVDWMEVASERLREEIKNGTESIPSYLLQAILLVAVQEHNQNYFGYQHLLEDDNIFEIFAAPISEESMVEGFHRYTFRQQVYHNEKGFGPQSTSFAQHIDICIGHRRQTPEMQKTLKCYYENKRHPYLYINPVKAEVLAEYPPVIQFYEMMSNSTIEYLIRLSRPYLSLSQLVGINVLDFQRITDERTSVGTGLHPEDLPETYKLAEMVSGLKIYNSSEPTQIIEYVYGRHYIYHQDAFIHEDDIDGLKKEGNRLATFLYYLEIPRLGGATSFCSAGISPYPEKGSSVLWINMYRNGTVRDDIDHGSCPVMHGSKIAGNHWIRYNGNWQHYKCSLNQFE